MMAMSPYKIRIWNTNDYPVPIEMDVSRKLTPHLRMSIDGIEVGKYIHSYKLKHITKNIHRVTLTLTAEVVFGKGELPDESETIATAEKQDMEWNPARRQMEQKSVSPNPLNWNWQDCTRGEGES